MTKPTPCEHGITAWRFKCQECIAAIAKERAEALVRIFPEAYLYRRAHREIEP